jgi:membrane-associated phospholipid phosphatase
VSEPAVDPLRNHRRVLLYSFFLLAALVLLLWGVGRHPGEPGTTTTLPAIGTFDGNVYDWIQPHRSSWLTAFAKFLSFIGAGLITIPLRIVVAVILAVRRRWRAFTAWLLTWAVAELLLEFAKRYFERTRPPDPLVVTNGYSFPSGHSVATASIVVALVLAFMPAGPRRRKWEVIAAAAAFVMALSRVYLNVHWFSDVVAGVLLGTTVALACVALIHEVMLLSAQRRTPASARGG